MPRIKRASTQPSDGIQSVVLAVKLLEAVSDSETAMRITDLADRLGTTKARVFRHLQTLAAHGYIVQNKETGRYYSGSQLILLGQNVIENLSLVNEGREIILSLCAEL